MFELVDDRSKLSTVITVQLQVSEWHGYLGDPTIAHAILDRLASRSMRSHRVAMPNESA